VKLLIPTVPSTFYCVGINYREHIIASAKRRGVEPVFPEKPDIGYRANNALCAHEDPIVKPKDAGEVFQYEGELVAVFGKRARNVSRENALAGYGVVIAEDGSADEAATEAERARQRAERGDAQNFDFGPSLEEVLANCKAETGLEPPKPAKPLRWSPLEPSADAIARVREGDGIPAPS